MFTIITKKRTTIILLSLILLLFPAVSFAQSAEPEPVSNTTIMFAVLLVVLVVVGLVLAKVKTTKNKERVRQLMEEMKEE